MVAGDLHVISHNTCWSFLLADVEQRDCNVNMMKHIIFYVPLSVFFYFSFRDKQTRTLQVESHAFSACDDRELELVTQHNCISKIIPLWSLNNLKYLVTHCQGSCQTHLHCSALVVTPLSRLR